MRTASRQASSPVSEAALARIWATWLSTSASGSSGTAAAANSASASLIGRGPPLDQPVGVEEQRVAGHELERDLLVLGVELHAEQHALGQRLDRGQVAADQHRRQVPGPGPAQQLGLRVVAAADHGSGDALGERAGGVVQPAQQLVRIRPGRGQPAQRVAGGDHAGDRVDAVAGDVADHEQQLAVGQLERVVPVARDQVARLGRAAADGDVHPAGLDQAARRPA